MHFSVCYVLINIHTYTTSAFFQVRVPVFPVSVICYNTSGLSDKCVPGLVSVMYNVLSSHALYSRLGAATVAAA